MGASGIEGEALLVSPAATLSSIKRLINQAALPMGLGADTSECSDSWLNTVRQGGALSARSFWDRVVTFHASKPVSVDWMMGKLDSKLSPLHLSRFGWRLLPTPSPDANAARFPPTLSCDVCHKRKVWQPPVVGEGSPLSPNSKFDMERGYAAQFGATLNSSHHNLCVFFSSSCSLDSYCIPESREVAVHCSLVRARLASLLLSVPPNTTPQLSRDQSSRFLQLASQGGLDAAAYLSDPAAALSALRSTHPEALPPNIVADTHTATLLLLALSGWSSVGVVEAAGQAALQLPRPIESPSKPRDPTKSIIGCHWCRRSVNLALFEGTSDEEEAVEDLRRKLRKTDEATALPSFALKKTAPRFDPIVEHRWYCPWVATPPTTAAAETGQSEPGFVLCSSAIFQERPVSASTSDSLHVGESAAAKILRFVHTSGLLK